MPDYTVPDRELAQLWQISNDMMRWIRNHITHMRTEISTWEPAPMPDSWNRQGDAT